MTLFRKGTMIAALAAVLMTPWHLMAQATKMAVTLTATYQDPNPKNPPASNPDITPSDTKLAKITAPNLLTLLNPTLGPITNGSWLSFDVDLTGGTGAIGALDKNGDFVDLSSAITIMTDTSGAGALTSSANEDDVDPIAQTITYLSDWTVTFDDGAGNSFNLNGVIKTVESLAKGGNSETVTFSGAVTGWGSYLGNNATFTGSISGTGKGTPGS